MSVHPHHPFPRSEAVAPLEFYFSAESAAVPAPRLRPLTALEQMYAYWGSDRDSTI